MLLQSRRGPSEERALGGGFLVSCCQEHCAGRAWYGLEGRMPRSPPFHPHPNRESYKDLLIFEERLKQNAERQVPSPPPH